MCIIIFCGFKDVCGHIFQKALPVISSASIQHECACGVCLASAKAQWELPFSPSLGILIIFQHLQQQSLKSKKKKICGNQ